MSYNPPIPQNQYRPYGDFGPVCDSLVPSQALPELLTQINECNVDADCPPGFVCLNGRCVREEEVFEPVWNPEDLPSPGVDCKVRLKEDGTIEYYDCKVDLGDYDVDLGAYDSSCILIDGVCYDWAAEAKVDLTLPEFTDFPIANPFACNKFDPDVNIRPVSIFTNSGFRLTYYPLEGTTPVTFPVSSVSPGEVGKAITVNFAEDGNSIETSGRGVGRVTLKLDWDDNTSQYGVFADSITVTNSANDSITFTRSGTSGSETKSIDISGDSTTMSITYANLNSANNPIVVENGGRKLCLKDGDNDDCNGSFTIEDVDAEPTAAISLWSEEAEKYAVWVNAAECTLPCLEQSVTYNIEIDEDAEYHFEFGADDEGELYWMDENLPFMTATTPTMTNPAIFPTSTGPSIASKVLTKGTYKFVIKCTNGVIQPSAISSFYFGTQGATTGAATKLALYQDLPVGSSLFPKGYVGREFGTFVFHNQQGDDIWWTDTNNDGVVNKNDDGFTADFNMIGGSGSGMILNMTLRPLIGNDALNRASRICINEIVNPGSGYQIGDLLQIGTGTDADGQSVRSFPFDIAPVKVVELLEDSWYGNFSSSNAVAIRTQNQPGWTSTGGAGDPLRNKEVLGFDVPNDSPSGKYLGFGVVDEEGPNQTRVATRTCQFDLDLRGVISITFHVIAGTDGNGGEIPNNIEESLRFSFDNSSWTRLGVSLQYSGLGIGQFRDKYGDWYEYTVSVPVEYRTAATTLYFEQTISGNPEYSVGYNGLSDAAFTAAYQNGGDVFGIYKITLDGNPNLVYDCNNISDQSYNWAVNPGGWYLKVCKHTPCRSLEQRPWVRSNSASWGDFMNAYSVWVSSNDPGPLDTAQTLRYLVPVEYDDTLTLEYSADNLMTITFDGTQVASATGGFTTSATTTFSTTRGNHILEMSVTNVTSPDADNNWSNNPAGGAWKLTHSNSPSFNPFAFSLYTNSTNPDGLIKDQFNKSAIGKWAYNNDGRQKQMWYPPDNAGGFNQNDFSGYNELPGNNDYSSDGFISSNLNEWHYSDDGGNAQLWYEVGETVQGNYEMTGGSGSGMVLKIELEAIAGGGGNPNNTRWRVKEVINRGTGYQDGDVLNFDFFTPRRNDLQLGTYSLTPDPIRLDAVYLGDGADPTDFVEEEFDMIGGTGSGMRLKIRMEPFTGKDGGNNNTKYKIVEVINAGTGYSVNDELYFNFNTPRRISLGLGTTAFSDNNVINNSVRLDPITIRTSADLDQQASEPYWHTRLVAGYLFSDTPTGNESE